MSNQTTEEKKSKGGNNQNHNASGRFVKGNTASVGHSTSSASKRQKLHHALMRAVSEKDIIMVITTLVTQAKDGDTQAAKLLFDRVFGKAKQFVLYQGKVIQQRNYCNPELRKQVENKDDGAIEKIN